MITFFAILVVLIGLFVFCVKMGSVSYSSDGYVFGTVVLALVIAGVLIAWAGCYYDSINTVLDAKSRMETVASYKYKEGVYFLNTNTVTKEEFEFALKYNSWLKTSQYWNKKPFFDAFKSDIIDVERPIKFIEEQK